jgi:hypothetical protein
MPYTSSTLQFLATVLVAACLCSITFDAPNDDESVIAQYITRERYRHQAEQNLRHLEGPEPDVVVAR